MDYRWLLVLFAGIVTACGTSGHYRNILIDSNNTGYDTSVSSLEFWPVYYSGTDELFLSDDDSVNLYLNGMKFLYNNTEYTSIYVNSNGNGYGSSNGNGYGNDYGKGNGYGISNGNGNGYGKSNVWLWQWE